MQGEEKGEMCGYVWFLILMPFFVSGGSVKSGEECQVGGDCQDGAVCLSRCCVADTNITICTLCGEDGICSDCDPAENIVRCLLDIGQTCAASAQCGSGKCLGHCCTNNSAEAFASCGKCSAENGECSKCKNDNYQLVDGKCSLKALGVSCTKNEECEESVCKTRCCTSSASSMWNCKECDANGSCVIDQSLISTLIFVWIGGFALVVFIAVLAVTIPLCRQWSRIKRKKQDEEDERAKSKAAEPYIIEDENEAKVERNANDEVDGEIHVKKEEQMEIEDLEA